MQAPFQGVGVAESTVMQQHADTVKVLSSSNFTRTYPVVCKLAWEKCREFSRALARPGPTGALGLHCRGVVHGQKNTSYGGLAARPGLYSRNKYATHGR